MVENVIQINGGITINVNVSVKKVIFGSLLHVIVKVEHIKQVLWMIQLLLFMILNMPKRKKLMKKYNL